MQTVTLDEAVEGLPPTGAARALRAGWYTVAVYLLFYIFSHIDRTVISMMVGPIKADLKIDDFKMGLLLGPVFALFYAFCGLPMGALVDRFSRRWLTAGGLVVWGLATCACGLAGSFPALFFGRMGVGVGESVLTPAAHSMISENFPKQRLAMAISVFTMGAVLGAGIALAVGGAVVHLVTKGPPIDLPVLGLMKPWQVVFLVVGLPSVLLAPLVFTVREKARAHLAPKTAETVAEVPAISFFRSRPALAFGLPVAFGLTNIICTMMTVWTPEMMVRLFHMNKAEVGLKFGLVIFLAGGIGQLFGASVVDWLYARGVKDAHIKYHMVGLAISAPAVIVALISGNSWVFLGLTAVFYLFTYPFVGYAAAALQIFASGRERGLVSGLFLAVITVIGALVGPTGAGWLSDHVFGKEHLNMAMATVAACAAPVALIAHWFIAREMRKAAD
ncbi:MAG: hypothetical protein JWP35_1266 [Caulobacter sp.]|nr:hypothetical protein [Caulobacter sp.]